MAIECEPGMTNQQTPAKMIQGNRCARTYKIVGKIIKCSMTKYHITLHIYIQYVNMLGRTHIKAPQPMISPAHL